METIQHTSETAVLDKRRSQVSVAGSGQAEVSCEKPSLAGSVSQRACTFCGSRVVLYPIADALHIVHGSGGCASYTWDIRGALSSGPQLHRESFTTDLRETEVVYGGVDKLRQALIELIAEYKPRAAFVYSTCITGLIGDDVDSVCREAELRESIPVIAVASEGFKGSKKDGYGAACKALARLVGTSDEGKPRGPSINIVGDFNIAGETWLLRQYYQRMGVEVVATLTGDGRVDDIRRAHMAGLNLVQCSGSMTSLAKWMEEEFHIPYRRVSYFGVDDTASALYAAADFFGDATITKATQALVASELARVMPELKEIRAQLTGRRAAIYVGGGFKAISLVKAFRLLGVKTVLVGTQTGSKDDYAALQEVCDPGTILADDSNPAELSAFVRETGADIFVGGVKERPLAHKLGLGFVDHNHERKRALAGFEGMLEFAREVRATALSPVWKWVR